MFVKSSSINVIALWFDSKIGDKGWYGAILSDGTPVGFASKEAAAWHNTPMLKKPWDKKFLILDEATEIFSDYTEKVLRTQGLMENAAEFKMIVPKELIHLVKS